MNQVVSVGTLAPNLLPCEARLVSLAMFERTLQDLIRGLRAHKASSKAQEDAFLVEAMGEIRQELKGKDMALKAEGVVKMCYVR
jgi:hypothetical protein